MPVINGCNLQRGLGLVPCDAPPILGGNTSRYIVIPDANKAAIPFTFDSIGRITAINLKDSGADMFSFVAENNSIGFQNNLIVTESKNKLYVSSGSVIFTIRKQEDINTLQALEQLKGFSIIQETKDKNFILHGIDSPIEVLTGIKDSGFLAGGKNDLTITFGHVEGNADINRAPYIKIGADYAATLTYINALLFDNMA